MVATLKTQGLFTYSLSAVAEKCSEQKSPASQSSSPSSATPTPPATSPSHAAEETATESFRFLIRADPQDSESPNELCWQRCKGRFMQTNAGDWFASDTYNSLMDFRHGDL